MVYERLRIRLSSAVCLWKQILLSPGETGQLRKGETQEPRRDAGLKKALIRGTLRRLGFLMRSVGARDRGPFQLRRRPRFANLQMKAILLSFIRLHFELLLDKAPGSRDLVGSAPPDAQRYRPSATCSRMGAAPRLDGPCPRRPSPRASSRRSPPLMRRRGTPAPIRPAARLRRPRANGSIRSSPMPFCMRSKASGSVGGRSGWTPAHVAVEDAGGRMVAAAPCYLKSHSQGEYVFDHAWADAYERAGGDYYPKLQVAVPFTPVTGRRLLVAGRRARGRARRADRGRCANCASRPRRRRSTSPFRPARTRERLAQGRLSACATASSSTSSTTATRFRRFSRQPWRRASARPSGASGATRWRRHRRSNC